ncbi:MAG: SEC-C metal-binding domain-containing protein [Clostridiales bacterium]
MDDYEKEFEKINAQTEEWLKLFFKSRFFEKLDEKAKNNASFAVGVFTDYMYEYEGEKPEEWDSSGLESCCIYTLPEKVTANSDFQNILSKVLEAYFLFLDENKFIKNGKILAQKVAKIENNIIEAFDNPSNWGMAKSFMMGAKESGVNIEDENDINRFIGNCNKINSLSTPKVGRNQPCPCGSGKKYKKCCLGEPKK